MIPLHDDRPSSLRPFVTVALIAACTLVFLWQFTLSEREQQELIYAFGLIPAVLFGDRTLAPGLAAVPPELSVLTSMFLHGGLLHLGGNMLYLWIFGNNVEDAMGHVRFVAFYLLCGVAAALAQAVQAPTSVIPMIGASGAIGGVLGGYLLLHPRARILVLVPLGFFLTTARIPAFVVLGLWFVLQFVNSAMLPSDRGGVAYWAHIGGFVAGMVLVPLFKRRDVALFDGAGLRRRPPGGGPTRRGPTRRGPWG